MKLMFNLALKNQIAVLEGNWSVAAITEALERVRAPAETVASSLASWTLEKIYAFIQHN